MQTAQNEFSVAKYIAKVVAMYSLDDRAEQKLFAGADMLTEAFGRYYWSDIERALEWYYQHNSDKSRPTIAALRSVLEELDITNRDGGQATQPNPYARPTTKIWSIRADFDRMIDVLVDGGVIPDTDGKYRNVRSIIDPATDLPVLNPMAWFGWKLCDVEQTRPDLFARFPNANRLEKLAIALGNHLIPFRVRDWAKLAAELRARNGGVMPRGDMVTSVGGM